MVLLLYCQGSRVFFLIIFNMVIHFNSLHFIPKGHTTHEPSENMLPNIRTCDNRWSNFLENLRVVAMNLFEFQFYQFTLILYSVGVRWDVDILKQTARAQSIYREVYGLINNNLCDSMYSLFLFCV